MPRIDSYPGTFLALLPTDLKADDVVLEWFSRGRIALDPAAPPEGESTVLLTFDGKELYPAPVWQLVRIFRSDEPQGASACMCEAAPGQKRHAECPAIIGLIDAAGQLWPTLCDDSLPGGELPGFFQKVRYQDLAEGDISFEPGLHGIVTEPMAEASPIWAMIRFDDQRPRTFTPDEMVRSFRPYDRDQVFACTNSERAPHGYRESCDETHLDDHCLELNGLLDAAFQLWPGLEEEYFTALEQTYEPTAGGSLSPTAAQECAARFESAMEAAARASGATASTEHSCVRVAWDDKSASYYIRNGLRTQPSHSTCPAELPTFIAVECELPEDRPLRYKGVLSVAFPSEFACNVELHACLAMAAIQHHHRLLTEEATHQA